MKTTSLPPRRSDGHSSPPASSRDENRYRAERPAGKFRVTKFQLQRWLIIALLILMVLGVLSVGAAEAAAGPDSALATLQRRTQTVLQRGAQPDLPDSTRR